MGRIRSDKYKKAYDMYKSGLSMESVGVFLGVTRQCVYKAFKLRGYELRVPNRRLYKMYDGRKFTLRNNGYMSLTTSNRMLMHRYVWEKEKGVIPDGWDIHHINGDKTDNMIENLECLPKAEHTRLYSPHNNQYTKGRKNAPHKLV